MAKQAKIKAVVTYVGKGKKNPVLPEAAQGTLTVTQGDVSHELPVYRLNGDVLFAKKELLGALGLKPAHAKSVPVIALGEGKRPAEYVNLQIANLLAATARVLAGPSPVTAYLLTPAFEGHADRLVAVTPQFGTVAAAE